jgi:hypothetical protein
VKVTWYKPEDTWYKPEDVTIVKAEDGTVLAYGVRDMADAIADMCRSDCPGTGPTHSHDPDIVACSMCDWRTVYDGDAPQRLIVHIRLEHSSPATRSDAYGGR